MRKKAIKIGLVLLIFIYIFPVKHSYGEKLTFETIIEEARAFKETGKVYFNFEKIDLKLLTYFIAELTGKNIVLGTDLKGTASLVFTEPVTIQQAWDIYTSILKARNYAIIDKGSHVEIVSSAVSRSIVPPVSVWGKKSDEIITYVYRLKNADIFQVLNVLRGLKSPRGLVFSYNPANVVVITDTASNIKNLKKVLSIIDTPGTGTGIKIYKLKYAESSEIASAINMIFGDYAKRGIPVKTFNLKSQNAVVVKAPNEVLLKINSLMEELDVPVENLAYRRFWTIYLKNAKAKDIANVLNRLLENITLVSFESSSQNNKKGKEKAPVKSPLSTTRTQKEKPKVIAEETSNALVVYANKIEYEAIKSLVDSLDRQKKQILITAFITEVSQTALKEMGVRWQIFGSQGGAAFKGGISDSGFYNLVGSSNFVAGVLTTSGKTVEINGNTLFFPELLFMFSLLEKGSGFNVISSPKILAMDNMKAKINVSQVIPYAESVKYDVNGNPIVNYDYKEVGLILEVTPHISGKNVIMELHQEVNDIIGYESAQVGNLSYIVPKTSKREIDTTITVENGKTVVLGGLISKKTVKTMEGVPVLSHIPVLGNLFKYRSDNKDKTNLFVFITPFVVEKPEDLAKITEEHMNLVKKLQKLKEKEEKKKLEEKSRKKDIMEQYREFFGG